MLATARISRQLHTDHVNMGKLLQLLDGQLGLLDAGESIDYALAMDILTYLTEYPDVYHHPKEDLLFSRWLMRESAAEPWVDQLTFEHQSIAHSGIHLLELLRAAAVDVMQSRDDLIAAGQRYIGSQRRHMAAEERVVFPRVTAALSDDDWREIDERLAAHDDPLFGKSVGQSFQLRYRQIRQLVEGQQ